MTRRTCIIALAIVATSLFAAFADTTQLIGWTDDLVLSWSMFQGAVPADAAPSQIAAIYMELKWYAQFTARKSGGNWTGYVSTTVVSNVMNPTLSWARLDRVTDSALRHEWYHFSLNEVYRRRAEAELKAVQVIARSAEEALSLVDQQVCQVGATWEAQIMFIQEQYESETNHGQDAAAQARWEANIEAWLINPATAP